MEDAKYLGSGWRNNQRRTRPWEAWFSHFRYQLPSREADFVLLGQMSNRNGTNLPCRIKHRCVGMLYLKSFRRWKKTMFVRGSTSLSTSRFPADQCNNEGWTRGVPVKRSPISALDAINFPGELTYRSLRQHPVETRSTNVYRVSRWRNCSTRENCPNLKKGLRQEFSSSTTWTRLRVNVIESTWSSWMQRRKKE